MAAHTTQETAVRTNLAVRALIYSILILFAPGTPREAFFGELAEIIASGRQLSEEELATFYRRHDQYMVDVNVET